MPRLIRDENLVVGLTPEPIVGDLRFASKVRQTTMRTVHGGPREQKSPLSTGRAAAHGNFSHRAAASRQ